MRLRGVSIAGICTSLQIPEVKLCVDIGLITSTSIRMNTLALTHGHVDHAGALANYLGQRSLMNMGPSRIIAPAPILGDLTEIVRLWERIQGRTYPVEWIPGQVGEDVDLGKGRFLRPFATDHTVPSLGYVLGERRKKLRPKYEGFSGEEVARLKRDGVDIVREHEVPLVAFSGDTMISALVDSKFARSAKVIVTELTFIGADESGDQTKGKARTSQELAHLGKHTHLVDLLAALPSLSCGQLVLMHFSAKHRVAELEALLERKIPREWLPKIDLLHHQDRNCSLR